MALVLPLLLLQHNFVVAFHGPAQQHAIRLAEESRLLGDLKHQLHETPHQTQRVEKVIYEQIPNMQY